MKPTRSLLRPAPLVIALATMMIGATAQAQTSEARERYQAERAACMNGTSHQDRQTCLQEAGAALGEARKGNLTGSDTYRQNALQRCVALPQNDREACVARVDGTGNISGSVEGGGVLRTYTQRIVGTPADAAPPPSSSQPQPRPAAGGYAPPPPPPPAAGHHGRTHMTPAQPVPHTPMQPAPAPGYGQPAQGAGTYAPPPARVQPAPAGSYQTPRQQVQPPATGTYMPNQANPATNASPAPGTATPIYQQQVR